MDGVDKGRIDDFGGMKEGELIVEIGEKDVKW